MTDMMFIMAMDVFQNVERPQWFLLNVSNPNLPIGLDLNLHMYLMYDTKSRGSW